MVTTIVGLIPLMLEKSIQAAFLKPIVIALAFGVGVAFFVTLLLVPSMYAIGTDLTAFRARNKARIKRLFGKNSDDEDSLIDDAIEGVTES